MTEDFPYRFEVSASAADLQGRFAELAPGAGSGQSGTVAGRVMFAARWASSPS